VCVRERERVSVCERESERVSVCVRERERVKSEEERKTMSESKLKLLISRQKEERESKKYRLIDLYI
jgi:hypothetical protein